MHRWRLPCWFRTVRSPSARDSCSCSSCFSWLSLPVLPLRRPRRLRRLSSRPPQQPRGRAPGRRSRWTRIAPGSSTCRRTRSTSRSAPTTSATSTRASPTEARYPELCKGIIDFKKVVVPQQRRRPRHPGVPLPADRQARPEGPRGDGLGARRRARQLGHHDVPVREGGRRARLRRHRARLPRQHGLRRGLPPGHRLRRLRGRRRDVGGGLPEDAAARRSRRGSGIMGWSHGGYITLLSVFREKHPFEAGAAIVPGHEPRVPPVVQGAGLPVGLRHAEARSRACRSRSPRSTSSARRSTTWTS